MAAQRQAEQLARTTDADAAVYLHQEAEKRKLPAAPPSKFRSRLHFARFQGPTARKDMEESEIQLLANLVVVTDTSMGKLLQSRQGDIALLGAGRRASTIRSRVRNIRHFQAWLAINYGITYPTEQTHLCGVSPGSIVGAVQSRIHQDYTREFRVLGHCLMGGATASTHELAALCQHVQGAVFQGVARQAFQTSPHVCSRRFYAHWNRLSCLLLFP